MRKVKLNLAKLKRDGSTTVELALVLPIFFTLMFAAFEFGHANMMRHGAQSAAYEAARASIVPNATNQDVQTAARRVLDSVGVRNFTLTTEPANIQTLSNDVTVNIAIPLDQNVTFATFVRGFVFTGTSRLSRERR
jgi:Flp pilus assembly protein TadG